MICTCGKGMIAACRKRKHRVKDIRLCTNCGRAVRLLTMKNREIVVLVIWPGRKQKKVVRGKGRYDSGGGVIWEW